MKYKNYCGTTIDDVSMGANEKVFFDHDCNRHVGIFLSRDPSAEPKHRIRIKLQTESPVCNCPVPSVYMSEIDAIAMAKSILKECEGR